MKFPNYSNCEAELLKQKVLDMLFYNSIQTMIRRNFPALTHSNFRLYWLGQCVSLIGTWAQNIGQTWLVLSITGSPILLGLMGAAQFLPLTIFSLFAGVIVDRYPKKKIILVTQFTSMILAFTLAFLVFTQTVSYGYILFLALILGLSNTIDIPARQAFTFELAGKEDLMNAVALNSATFNAARIIGPAIGAVLMASFGAGFCFVLNGLSFLAVIMSLLKIKTSPYVRKKSPENNIFGEIKAGLIYIVKEPVLSQTMLMVLTFGLFVYNFNILIPVFTKDILFQEEKVYGFLMSALGLGSLLGALMVSVKSQAGPSLKTLFRSTLLISMTFILISFTKTFYLTAILLVATGICNIWFTTNANSTLQMTTKDAYRGRVMSVYSLVFAGATPFGNIFAGWTSDLWGANTSFLISGVVIIFLTAFLAVLFRLRRSKSAVL